MISAFEYVTVFISIILGLGVAQILTGIADLIHQSNRVKVYWPHLLWIFLVLILHVQEWIVTFQLRSFGPWRLPVFLFIILYPVVLFVLARLLFPFGLSEGVIDLKKFYFENYRKIFLFGAILAGLTLLDNLFIRDYQGVDMIGPMLVLSGCSLLAVFKSEKTWVHEAFPLLMVLLLLISVALSWDRWLVAN
jgi:hypothetical protein